MSSPPEDGSREPYETPTIIPLMAHQLVGGARTTYGASDFGAIAGKSVLGLLERHGSPLYVVDARMLRQRYRELLASFRKYYEDTVIGWSYKTSYLSAICALYRGEGALAEVVSGFEYGIARDLGIPGTEIIFNGPHKTDDELRTAFVEKAIVNLDSFDEIERAARIAATLGACVPVGIRLNMQLNYPPWDKFGFPLEAGQAAEAVHRIQRSGHLRLRGLHVHCGTFVTDLSLYSRAVEKIIALALRIEAEHGVTLEYLDLGGGFASKNTLHDQFLRGEASHPTFEQYAEVIGQPVAASRSQFRGSPTLYLEPGRAIVDEGAHLLTRVVATKRMTDGVKGVIVDAGVHLLPTSYWYKHEIVAAREATGALEEYHVFGALCMQIDCLCRGVRLPPLHRDDVLIIRNVGAYNYSQGMTFIYPRPAFIMIEDGREAVIRAPENAGWIRSLDRLPAFLRNEENRASSIPESESS